MSNQISTQTISFNNQSLITLEQNGTFYVAMKPICENIGLAWHAQFERIKRDDVLGLTMIVMITVADDGKNREMVCLPIEYLNGWLFGIDVKRCKPEIRETLIKYKKECYQALHDYWLKGKAERKTTVDERTGLRDAVNMLVSKKGLIYSEAYNLVHQRFNVSSIEQLTPEQLPQAVEYVHKICLEGELIINDPEKKFAIELTEDELQSLTWAWFAFVRGIHTFRYIYPMFQKLGSNMAGEIYGQGFDYCNTAQRAHKVLQKLTADIAIDPMTNWRVLKHVRDFDPMFKKPTF